AILGGRFGRSPHEFWKVALIDDMPAGFIGGFIKEGKHLPVTGVLGPLGVFPEFRRLGVGVFLVSELFKSMKNHGCEYAAVGTPSNNRNAIAMYQKAGYKLNCHLSFLEKVH
ncbi:GNAT family N-acetyltransferase, partial [Candidatus Thorarchaeota archaeon]